MEKSVEIVATHGGKFHTDEVFAIAILKQLYPKLIVWRTRDPEKYNQADMCVDISSEYDPERLRFDHHQKGGAGKRENNIPYASAGLIWKHYGKRLTNNDDGLHEAVDKLLMQPIDAIDSGVDLYETLTDVHPFTLSNIMLGYLPVWDDEDANFDAAFMRAVDAATTILLQTIEFCAAGKRGEQIVLDAIAQKGDKEYIVLPVRCPWMETTSKHKGIKFVIFPNSEGRWSSWAARDNPMSFENRHEFPKEWAGLRDEQLQEISGVPDALFCHDHLFCVSAVTKDGVIKLVELALEKIIKQLER